MSVSVTRGTNDKPVASRKLSNLFSNYHDMSGDLFIGFPIISTPRGRHRIDALYVSPVKGIVIFDLIEGTNTSGYEDRQDDSANKLEGRLKTYRSLMHRRSLLIPIHTISFAPGVRKPEMCDEGYPLANSNTVRRFLQNLDWPNRQENVFKSALSAIQNISTIRRGKTSRTTYIKNSRGAKLGRLEDSIATLDNMQSKAVVETVEGVQRIRGLAGSGKTIVLALKAAYLHAQQGDWRIAVTFNTRSLKEHFRRLIYSFFLEQTGEEPNWDRLRILNAWGAPGGRERDGVYHEFCRANDIEYFDFRTARNRFGQGREFSGVCKQAVRQIHKSKSVYDVILVDEAQDFAPQFIQLCYNFLDQHKRLVYAYDELQNLSGQSLPSPEDLFGRDQDGSPLVRLDNLDEDKPRGDVILEKCYRNSRPVLTTAHALGFGIYREPPNGKDMGLIQMFDQSHLWQEIGYRVKDGELSEGSSVTLYRSEDGSPKFLEDHSEVEDLIQFIYFRNEGEQTEWLVNAILENMKNDELQYEDIIVINPDPRTTRAKVGPIRRRLLECGINSQSCRCRYGPRRILSRRGEISHVHRYLSGQG